jgi:hypothetical protein
VQALYRTSVLCDYLSALLNTIVDFLNRDLLVHELGHLIPVKLFYQNSRPLLVLAPFSLSIFSPLSQAAAGYVSYFPSLPLSSLGLRIGTKAVQLAISAGGAGATTIFSTAFIVTSHRVRKTNPYLSRVLLCMAILSIANAMLYALSALQETSSKGHDFAALAAGGIHPLTSAAVIASVPLGTKAGLMLYDRCRKTDAKI